MTIYYLGPQGSYSHALLEKLHPGQRYVPCRTFSEVVEKVRENDKSHGLLGIENSISSSVHESIDLLYLHKDIRIIQEACMNISLHLIGTQDARISDIRTVYSYPQALAQCSQFIESHSIKSIESPSTTAAVHEVDTLQNTTIGAIAGKGSIAGTDLMIIQEHIGNETHNLTRWVVITKDGKPLSHNINKMTIIFRVKHEPGSLVRVLQAIADKRGNMSKIESRPVPGSEWEYEFWVDIEIPSGEVKAFETLMSEEALSYRIVGTYQKGETYE